MESVVKHVPNTYYLELRQDYITLCLSLTYRKDKSKSSPHCKALILSIMEKWTNDKISKQKDPHISMTYPQWIDEMYGIFGRSVIIDSLDELIEEKLITRESYKAARGGRDQYKYLLDYELLNKSLNPTFTNQPCEEEQSVKVNDQGLQVNVATSKNKPCPSSPTFKSKPFIESDTQNQNIKSTKESPPSRASQFSSEQNRIDELFFQCTRKRPTITEDLKGYWDTLAPDIKTLEDMRNLYTITEKECAGKTNPRVYPGNLADCLKLWRQQYGSLPWSQPDNSQPEPDKEPETDIPMYADRPLFYWTEETMEAVNLPKLRRRVIREKQMEWKQGQSVIAS